MVRPRQAIAAVLIAGIVFLAVYAAWPRTVITEINIPPHSGAKR
jgi:hypothetical protein